MIEVKNLTRNNIASTMKEDRERKIEIVRKNKSPIKVSLSSNQESKIFWERARRNEICQRSNFKPRIKSAQITLSNLSKYRSSGMLTRKQEPTANNLSQKTLDTVNSNVILKYIDQPDKLEKHLPFRQIPQNNNYTIRDLRSAATTHRPKKKPKYDEYNDKVDFDSSKIKTRTGTGWYNNVISHNSGGSEFNDYQIGTTENSIRGLVVQGSKVNM